MPSISSAPVRRRIVGTSLKMYFDYCKTLEYVQDVVSLAAEYSEWPLLDADGEQSLDMFVIPDFVSIVPIQSILHASTTRFWVGAQDTFDVDTGPYTGEVSPVTLSQAGCALVEIGHAERRRQFGETDEWVAQKAGAIVRNNMIPLVCVGELTKDDVRAAVSECWQQLCGVFDAVPDSADVIVAYEPVWAIGMKKPAGAEHIVTVAQALRQRCLAERPQRSDASLRIVYGGSAKPGLYEHIYHAVDGLFLGRFAHDPAMFLKAAQEVYAAGRGSV
ncbi:triose-phosphate isomerase [Malassezia vespertilionis]|uniref:Triosephosphate isomerase n=1 Tax=Malassezia vespertilionis TaxID=2020962 RepID=A0A2N1JB92_9BASI|nr:triose-phosphate isomerase [Malassezia vespertilionis]PKI83782.1 hypothetical protein MVES_001973 [Malassezia vespertilionis]WFD06732.1 triose-phosphate isomerase [Malassezia vespertilionis]